jgi:prophage antirepressor-like protein
MSGPRTPLKTHSTPRTELCGNVAASIDATELGVALNDSTSFNHIVLSYPGTAGQQAVRTIKRGDEVLFSLEDVVKVLAAENGRLSRDEGGKGFKGIFAAQIEALDSDEQVVVTEPQVRHYDLPHQTYVTQPGLFRVVLRDTSPAAKQFQRWILHEVLPSIQKHGTYPPPLEHSHSSDIRRATELLLEEIKAREELERQTKVKFDEHEARIEALANRITEGTGPDRLAGCITVAEFCSEHDFDESRLQFIVAMSQKLCLEQTRPQGKKDGTTGSRSSTHLFPTDIIEMSINMTRED